MGFTVMMLVGSGSAIAEGGGADGGGTGGGGAGSGNGCTLSSIVCHQKHTGKHTWRGGNVVATHSFWLDDDHSSTSFVLGSFAFPAERAVNEGICMSRYCSLAGARALIKNRWVGAAFGNSTDDTELIPALVYRGTRKLAALRPRGRPQTGPTGTRASGSTGSQAAIYTTKLSSGLSSGISTHLWIVHYPVDYPHQWTIHTWIVSYFRIFQKAEILLQYLSSMIYYSETWARSTYI